MKISEENKTQEFRLKNIDDTIKIFTEEIDQDELMSKKHKKVYQRPWNIICTSCFCYLSKCVAVKIKKYWSKKINWGIKNSLFN